ncbi:MAG: rhodanese-like domain-containing protein, partial [bacterium]|nr:rhodanese-like domain-containing protein [bacterium]
MGYTNVKVFEDGMPAWLKVPGNYACVTGDWVKKKLDKKAPMTLIDSRPKRKKYKKGHIPTAISLPDSKFNKLSNKLPQDKQALIVFYCGGYKCKLSHKSAKKALKLGYTNVKVFSGGYPEWKKASGVKASKAAVKAVHVKAGKEEGSIAIASFKKILKKNPRSIMLIDVR